MSKTIAHCFAAGIDIGGTKIAAAVFDKNNNQLAQISQPTPQEYGDMVGTCVNMIRGFDEKLDTHVTVGVGVPGAIDHETGIVPVATNTPALSGRPLQKDLAEALNRRVHLANDADCAGLSEAVDGVGQGFPTVLGLIMGTGVGAGLVSHGRIVEGVNGLTGEFGHIPMPFMDDSDLPDVSCVCGQKGCLEKAINGAALARLYTHRTGDHADAVKISAMARHGDSPALSVLDEYFTLVAKAMALVIHIYDPHVIAVSGGLNSLPGLYEKVPQRWGQFCMIKNPKTKFLPAKHGAMSGLRGAAWVGRGL